MPILATVFSWLMVPAMAQTTLVYDLQGTSTIRENCTEGGQSIRSRVKMGFNLAANPRQLQLSLRLCTAAAGYQRSEVMWNIPSAGMNPQFLRALAVGSATQIENLTLTRLPDGGDLAWFRLQLNPAPVTGNVTLGEFRVAIPLSAAGQAKVLQLTGTVQTWSHFQLTLRHRFLSQPIELRGTLDRF